MTWELRMPHYYRSPLPLSRNQHWIFGIYRSATCSFSKSSGAVRYVPKDLRQARPQTQDASGNSRLNQPNGEVGPSMRGRKPPSEAQECSDDRKLIRRRSEASAAFVREYKDRDLPSASESMELPSFDVIQSQMTSNYVQASLTNDLGERRLSEASHHANKSGEEAIIWPASARLQTVAKSEANNVEMLSGTSGYLAMSMVPPDVYQTSKQDGETVGKREEVLSLQSESNTFSRSTKESSRLALPDAKLIPKDADFEIRKSQMYQDAESFLSKIPRSKVNNSIPTGMPHTAATDHSSAGINKSTANMEESLEGTIIMHEGPHLIDSYSTVEHEHAKNQAIRCLAMRPFTAAQLREKLIGQKIAPLLADYAVATLQNCGLQNDMAYAETFSSSRFDHGSWGPQKIRQALKRRGIKDGIIKTAIAKVFHEGNSDSAEEEADILRYKGVDISKAAMDQLLIQATKKWNRGTNVMMETKMRRMICWLQYRGFSYSVIKHVLLQLRKGVPLEH